MSLNVPDQSLADLAPKTGGQLAPRLSLEQQARKLLKLRQDRAAGEMRLALELCALEAGWDAYADEARSATCAEWAAKVFYSRRVMHQARERVAALKILVETGYTKEYLVARIEASVIVWLAGGAFQAKERPEALRRILEETKARGSLPLTMAMARELLLKDRPRRRKLPDPRLLAAMDHIDTLEQLLGSVGVQIPARPEGLEK